jgi:hypothetical protein
MDRSAAAVTSTSLLSIGGRKFRTFQCPSLSCEFFKNCAQASVMVSAG